MGSQLTNTTAPLVKTSGSPVLWRRLLLLAVAYLLAAQVSLSFILEPENIAPFWLASGVSLAVLVFSPRAHWPYLLTVVFLVNLFGNLYREYEALTATGFALANVVEPWLGAWLIRRYVGGIMSFERLSSTTTWLIAAVIAAAAGATFGATVAAFAGISEFWQLWQLWWIDDLIGILVLGSLIVAVVSGGRAVLRERLKELQNGWLAAWVTALAVLSVVVFARETGTSAGYFAGSAYLAFPVMLWLAIRFGPVGATLGGFILTIIAVWGTVIGHGPFVVPGSSQSQQVLALQIFLSVTLISSLLLASLLHERNRGVRQLRRTQGTLQARLAFEKRLAEVSAGFINMPVSDIDDGINAALSEFSELLEMDRAHVMQLSPDTTRCSATHEWVAEGLEPLLDELQDINAGNAPFFFARLAQGENIIVVQTDELPPEAYRERQLLEKWGKKSLLIVPLYVDGKLTGVVAFSTSRRKSRWSATLIPQVQLISDVLANALIRRRSMLELAALNAELEQRIEVRTAELNALNRELEAFSYSVSHDLRAPLRRITGFADELRVESGEQLNAQGSDFLQRIQASAEDMSRLIEDLLGLSRVNQQPLRREQVNLSALARNVAANLQADRPDHQVEFDIHDTGEVYGDAGLLRALMENLIGNAWKYSFDNDTPRIEFGESLDAGVTEFYVRDNGIGFDMEYADQLFVPFQRLHNSEPFAGSGIGLATVQRIVHRHGGRVRGESEPGHGSVFRFTIGDAVEQ